MAVALLREQRHLALRPDRIHVVLATAMAFGLVISGCGGNEKNCQTSEGSLQATLDRLVVDGSADELAMANVVSVGWDRVYVFGEYTGAWDVRKASGLEYLGVASPDSSAHVPEHSSLVVFTLEGSPRCYELVSLPSDEDEDGWSFSGRIQGVARSDAVFRVIRGERFAQLVLSEPYTRSHSVVP